MWKTKLCLATNSDFEIPVEQQIRLFKKVGFDGFFPEWTEGCEIGEWRKVADECGMIFQSVHAPFGRAADIWGTDDKALETVNELISCLRDCAEYGVPLMIAHAFIGFESHDPTKAGIENFKKVAAEAQNLGVKIALENTEGEEYLSALMGGLADYECVGFCWDSGHEMCYNHSKDMLALYGDRLFGTHLNDNLGIRDFDGEITWRDDLHLLPFDGIADWKYNVSRLNKCGYNGILTFELNRSSKPDRYDNDIYRKITIEEYVTEAYKRACRVAALKQSVK